MAVSGGDALENEAYKALPKLLEQDYGIIIAEALDRDFVEDNKGREIEVNILGKERQNGKEILIVGEFQSRVSINDINTFLRKKLKRLEGLHPNLFPVVVTHMVSSKKVESYAREKGIALYKSSKFTNT
ncbi:MAG: hypothetical protein Kow0042_21430 [Calditrichia bacterium]